MIFLVGILSKSVLKVLLNIFSSIVAETDKLLIYLSVYKQFMEDVPHNVKFWL